MNEDSRKLREDANESAFRILQEATGEKSKTAPPGERDEPNPIAVERGRKGGEQGGVSRAKVLSEMERQKIAALPRRRDGTRRRNESSGALAGC